GGNGDYDGTTGTPTYLTLTLAGLPANTYAWSSSHIDTEHVHGDFEVAVSTDGGATYAALPNGRMVDAADGGNPNSIDSGFQSVLAQDSGSAALEGGIYSAVFTADGSSDVVVRFAPLSQTAVHRQIFGINGFVIQAVPEPSALSLIVFAGLAIFGFARRR
ncbi:MAG: PEP-CTERM sorting domain-containing protein, partial [Planctomycetota bacterium]